MKITISKVFEGQCPYCGSENVQNESTGFIDEMMYRTMFCDDCHRVYEEWYNISFAGVNVGRNCGMELEADLSEPVEVEMD